MDYTWYTWALFLYFWRFGRHFYLFAKLSLVRGDNIQRCRLPPLFIVDRRSGWDLEGHLVQTPAWTKEAECASPVQMDLLLRRTPTQRGVLKHILNFTSFSTVTAALGTFRRVFPWQWGSSLAVQSLNSCLTRPTTLSSAIWMPPPFKGYFDVMHHQSLLTTQLEMFF